MNNPLWPDEIRPREKLLQKGATALSDAELLAIFLRTGVSGNSALDLARQLLHQHGSLRALLGANQLAICRTKGVGKVKYAQLQAALEMAQRHLSETLQHRQVFHSAEQTRLFLLSQLRDEQEEVFAVMLLDSQHRMLNFKKLFFGTINAASVYPRVIVKTVLEYNAAALILAHNHPSGVAEPSEADRSITKRIQQSMELVDVSVLDHFVIGDGHCISFAQRGWI